MIKVEPPSIVTFTFTFATFVELKFEIYNCMNNGSYTPEPEAV